MDLISIFVVYVSHPSADKPMENDHGHEIQLPAVPRTGERLYLPRRDGQYASFTVSKVSWFGWTHGSKEAKCYRPRVEIEITYFPEE